MQPVIGHAAVEQRFTASLSQNRMHHAWLLYGMKGIGKRTLAEKLAACLVCESQSACGECHGCKMLAAGSHPDVYRSGLIEGKRDVNIEQVRDLLSFMSLSGAESGRRVVILDDAERLNNQAANALLKGLEEPADGSVLLIVCSDLERLPATVRSRCMLQQCSPLSDEQVAEVLQQQEASIDGRFLDLAVELANGCPGAISCMQDDAIATALFDWQGLTADLAHADVGKIEAWIRSHIKLVPHVLIVQMLMNASHPALQQGAGGFSSRESLQTALQACIHWPGEVVRHSLRAGPSLLACLLQLRTALRAVEQSQGCSE